MLVGLPDSNRVARLTLPYVDTLTLLAVGAIPVDISFDASQAHAFITNELSDQVIEMDVASGAHIGTIATTGDPFASVLSADGATLYIATNTNFVYAVPLATPTTFESMQVDSAVGGAPNFMVLSPDGSTLYVSTRTGGTIVAIDTRTFTVSRTLSGGGLMQQAVVSPDGGTVYAVNENGNLYVWTGQSSAPTQTIPLGGQAWALAMTPDARQMYVSLLNTGQVLVVDRGSLSIVATIPTGGVPRRIAFTEQGKVAIVANEAGYISFIN
ncbi:MAG TPA: hypothetical protein VFA43_07495 [Gemmatimonadaceae bacterium]|nr:hypothetical protein [Gemmatimonadaceae bacterium]